MQRRPVVPVPMRFYHDFNILIECHEETQKTLDGKLPELAAHELGDEGWRVPNRSAASTCFRRRRFMMASILDTGCALTMVLFFIRDADVLEDVPVIVPRTIRPDG